MSELVNFFKQDEKKKLLLTSFLWVLWSLVGVALVLVTLELLEEFITKKSADVNASWN